MKRIKEIKNIKYKVNDKKVKKIKLIILITLLIINILNTLAFAIDVPVRKMCDCPTLMKYKGKNIKTTYVVAKMNGEEYPAYCLDVSLPGVSDKITTYKLNTDNIIQNEKVYKTIINGYPYKSVADLGVNTKEEAFAATKQAVYTALYNRNVSDYSAIETESGKRTYEAYKKIVNDANYSSEKYKTPNFIVKTDNIWENVNDEFLEMTLNISAKMQGQYDIKLLNEGKYGGILEFNKEKQAGGTVSFKLRIKFKDLNKFDENEVIKFKVNGVMATFPVFFGKAENSNYQSYAISGAIFEHAESQEISVKLPENNSEIVLEKTDDELKVLKGVKFRLIYLKDLNNENNSDNLNNVEETVIEKETDENGKIEFKKLLPGKYLIEEIKTIEGYELLKDKIEVEVKFNELSKINVKNKKIELKIEPKAEKIKRILPKTGY